MLVGPSCVGIGHHDVGRYKFAIAQGDAGGATVLNFNSAHGSIQTNVHPALLQQLHQPFHNGSRAAHGRVHTPSPL